MDVDFISRTYGKLTFEEMFNVIKEYVEEMPSYNYNIIIGADSQNFGNDRDGYTKMVTVVTVRRVGKGGIFFYNINYLKCIREVEPKLFHEVSLSLDLATKVQTRMKEEHLQHSICVHIDGGENGKSKKVINNVVGMVRGCGFSCEIKPDSYAASTIADRISK